MIEVVFSRLAYQGEIKSVIAKDTVPSASGSLIRRKLPSDRCQLGLQFTSEAYHDPKSRALSSMGRTRDPVDSRSSRGPRSSAHASLDHYPQGVDDDSSGTVTTFEPHRALLESNFRPNRAIKFHQYSVESASPTLFPRAVLTEVLFLGCWSLGLQAVVKEYKAHGVEVVAMGEFDTTAWVKRGIIEEAVVTIDFTNEKLTRLNEGLFEECFPTPYADTKRGYACRDHTTWEEAGYPAILTADTSSTRISTAPTSESPWFSPTASHCSPVIILPLSVVAGDLTRDLEPTCPPRSRCARK